MQNIQQIAIVGTGLLGGSIGLGLRKAGFSGRIVGVGRRRATLDEALEIGCVDEVSLDVKQAAGAAQLVILATPLGSFERLMGEIAEVDHGELIVTDVGSTKKQVLQLAKRILPKPENFVGSHPMAGGELHGPGFARADLLDGRPCIVVSDDRNHAAVKQVEAMWSLLKMRIVHMTADEHDRKTAAISHWPHAAAALLVELASQIDGLDIASTGFADVTRVASGDPQVWADIFSTNRESVLEMIGQYEKLMMAFRETLQCGDREQMVTFLGEVKRIRDDWVSKPALEDGGE